MDLGITTIVPIGLLVVAGIALIMYHWFRMQRATDARHREAANEAQQERETNSNGR